MFWLLGSILLVCIAVVVVLHKYYSPGNDLYQTIKIITAVMGVFVLLISLLLVAGYLYNRANEEQQQREAEIERQTIVLLLETVDDVDILEDVVNDAVEFNGKIKEQTLDYKPFTRYLSGVGYVGLEPIDYILILVQRNG